MTKISAQIVADSKNEYGNRITTMLVTFPRFILAELNTHRMLSKNSASSRAIPYKKMLKSVMEKPFVPIAFQKDHSGMQGTEYLDAKTQYDWKVVREATLSIFTASFDKDDEDYDKIVLAFDEVANNLYQSKISIEELWLKIRSMVVFSSMLLAGMGVTKQLCNRLLEPFMWHTVLITATEWENFFALRCPKYETFDELFFRSRKDFVNHNQNKGISTWNINDYIEIEWLQLNKGQAEIHMMALAEAMWDALNESTPKELKVGEWHIPFGDDITDKILSDNLYNIGGTNDQLRIKIAIARCARTSYTVVGEEGKKHDYEADIKLHDRLAQSGHWSPFEHCAKSMSKEEFYTLHAYDFDRISPNEKEKLLKTEGWSGNFKGFIQYRKQFTNENITK